MVILVVIFMSLSIILGTKQKSDTTLMKPTKVNNMCIKHMKAVFSSSLVAPGDDLDFENTRQRSQPQEKVSHYSTNYWFTGNMMKLPQNLLQCWNVNHPISVCIGVYCMCICLSCSPLKPT